MSCLIATPTRARSMDFEYMVGLMRSQGLHGSWMPMAGQTDVYVARNSLANEFLHKHSTVDDLIFIDSDIGFTREHVMDLLSTPHPLVSGIYASKTVERKPVFFPMEGAYTRDTLPETGLIAAKYVPCGFLKINRSVFETLIERRLVNEYGPSDKPLHQFFIGLIEDRNLLSEDFSFSYLCRQADIQPYVNCKIRLNHDGIPV